MHHRFLAGHLVARHNPKGDDGMSVAFKLPPMVSHAAAYTGLQAAHKVMRPFFINNGYADRYGVDEAHIHYGYDLDTEAVRRVDFPEARTRVTSVVPKAEVDPERAVGWWFGPDGAVVPSLFAAEEAYTAPGSPQDLAKIGAFFAANGLTKYGVRSLQRPFTVHATEMEVEYTSPHTRIQVFSVIPRNQLDASSNVRQSVWRFTGSGVEGATDCFNYCGLPPKV
jgi:hypothetical protein